MRLQLFFVLFLICIGFGTFGQRGSFRPYVSFGPELRLNFANIEAHAEGTFSEGRSGSIGPGFDAIFTVDYGFIKWLGVSGGVGLSSVSTKYWKPYYYVNMPVRLQIKLGPFWVEPGVENRFFVGSGDLDWGLENGEMNTYVLYGSIAGRLKLFRGLSVSVGYSQSLTEVAYSRHSYIATGANSSYSALAWFVGLRYMFNQPYDKRRR